MQKPENNDRQRFARVWDAIEDIPEEATRMKARSAERMRQEAAGAHVAADRKLSHL
jgi:predicted XRE-type DNA-binding protein